MRESRNIFDSIRSVKNLGASEDYNLDNWKPSKPKPPLGYEIITGYACKHCGMHFTQRSGYNLPVRCIREGCNRVTMRIKSVSV